MALNSRISVSVLADYTSTLDFSTPIASLVPPWLREVVLASGTGVNQADKVFWDQRTVTASGTDPIDLAGTLTDPFGAVLTFARIKFVAVYAAAANTNDVRVTRPATNAVPLLSAAGYIPVQPGGLFVWASPAAAGVAVTAGTGDIINFDNSGAGTSVTYDVVIGGASA
jgi:hypothetical protein